MELERWRLLEARRAAYRARLVSDADFAAQKRREAEALVYLGRALWDGVRQVADWFSRPSVCVHVHQTVNVPVTVNLGGPPVSVDAKTLAAAVLLLARETARPSEKVHDVVAVETARPSEKVHDVVAVVEDADREQTLRRAVAMYREERAKWGKNKRMNWQSIYDLCWSFFKGLPNVRGRRIRDTVRKRAER